MPSASGAGAVSYLERRAAGEAAFARHLASFLTHDSFRATGNPATALRDIERDSPQQFGEFRDAVYEAYYTNPAIWRLLGYEFRPSRTRHMKLPAFDEHMLERVRTMKPLFRDVP